MRLRSLCSIAIVLSVTLTALACGGSTTTPTTVSAVLVTGSAPGVGANAQFKATATMSDGSTQDVTAAASWGSSNNAVATVSATGVVTGVADGTVSVTATYQTVTGSDQITLND